MDWHWKYFRWLGAGVLLGSYGLKILTSSDMKKLYTHGTAAVLRMKDEVLKDVSLLVTDSGIDPDALARLKKLGIQIETV